MQIVSSYAIKLSGDLKALENSIIIYREALSFVIPIVNNHWDEMKDFEFSNQRNNYVENLSIQQKITKLFIILMGNFINSHAIYVELLLQVQLV